MRTQPLIPSRRLWLTLAGLAVLGVAIPACRNRLGQILFSPKAPHVPPPVWLGNPFKHRAKSPVAIVGGADVPAMVARAVELIGSLGKLQLAGARTLLKPNVVGGKAPPITTDPGLVKALVVLVQAEMPPSLAVGERSSHLYVMNGLQSLEQGGLWAGEAVLTQVILASAVSPSLQMWWSLG